MFVENVMTDPLLRIVLITLAVQLIICAMFGIYHYIDGLSEAVTVTKFFLGGWLVIFIVYLAFHWVATSDAACSGVTESSLSCFILTLPVQGMVWMDRALFSIPVVGTFYGSP